MYLLFVTRLADTSFS